MGSLGAGGKIGGRGLKGEIERIGLKGRSAAATSRTEPKNGFATQAHVRRQTDVYDRHTCREVDVGSHR